MLPLKVVSLKRFNLSIYSTFVKLKTTFEKLLFVPFLGI